MTKRLVDILIAAAGLILLSPLMLATGLVVALTSPGGALFRQTRLGRGEEPFTLYKFRTMRTGVPDVGTHDAAADWQTPQGRFLRATKLDELPQLFNVLIGDMSLVGPRPNLPSQIELIVARRQHQVYAMRPGITGLAQSQNIDMRDPDRLAAIDGDYVARQSLGLDFNILLRTFFCISRADRTGAKPS